MILNRLYELAVRKQLLADTAFETQPVPFIVVLDQSGKFLGIDERRGEIVTIRRTKKGETVKRTRDRGTEQSVPRPHGNTASQGFARFFVDTLLRVLPLATHEADRAKIERSRATFWQQIDSAAEATNDPALRAVQAFGREFHKDASLVAKIQAAVAEKTPASGDRVTFAYHPDGGKTILERPEIRKWYSDFFSRFTKGRQETGPIGFCTLVGHLGPLPKSHPIKLSGIPGGLPTGVSIVSFDKAAFRHYGLDGAENAAIGYEGADGYTRGFQWLRSEKDHHFVIGGTLFLFWTRQDASTDFVMALGAPDAEQVRKMLEPLLKGQQGDAIDETDDFYLLAVSGNSARAIVREYLERKLGQVRTGIRKWFEDLRIADTSREHQGRPNAAFPMWMLANATALDSDRVAPDTNTRLMHSALTGAPLPHSILACCLARLRAEGKDGFRSARMGLIKLCLNRTYCKENPMTETLDTRNRIRDTAYVCGRLLAFMARCQSPKDFGASAQIVERFFGSAILSPRSVLPTLLKMNRNHISIIRGQNKGFAFNLDKELDNLLDLITPPGDSVPDFPATLTLGEQGRFALGFYQQRAEYRRISAEKQVEQDELLPTLES